MLSDYLAKIGPNSRGGSDSGQYARHYSGLGKKKHWLHALITGLYTWYLLFWRPVHTSVLNERCAWAGVDGRGKKGLKSSRDKNYTARTVVGGKGACDVTPDLSYD